MRLTLIMCLISFAGCWTQGPNEVVVYTALDREFSEPILADFTAETGIRALPKYDDESTKTVGLTSELMAAGDRPRCDVFWNNEILNTLRLEEQGLLEVYRPPGAKTFPDWCRSATGTWHGFAARARVLIVNTELVPADKRPGSIYDLANPEWKGKVGIARPIAGTTATHAACLFAQLGTGDAQEFFRSLKANDIQILSGNKQVAAACAAGQIAFGLTDTDDAIIEVEKGSPVTLIYPDRNSHQLGTLFIPNTLAIIKGGPNPVAARRLVDYLLSAQVEERLAAGASAQIPLSRAAKSKPRVETPQTVHPMEVDFSAAARAWDAAGKFIRDEFLAP